MIKKWLFIFVCVSIQLHTPVFCGSAKDAKQSAEKLHALKFSSLSRTNLEKIALFIETKLPGLIRAKHYYIATKESGLACPIEYDPITRYRFIHLERFETAFLGAGANKSVTKSILYDRKHPEILARCQVKNQNLKDFMKEFRLLKKLRGNKGIAQFRAFATHIEDGVQVSSLFLTFYNAGSFQKVLKEKGLFTLKEKISLALDILSGIEALHKKGIAHRDIKPHNFLIKIPNKNKKKVVGVIADLGRAIYIHGIKGMSSYANPRYASPEAVFQSKLHGKGYFQADLFMTGCIFYKLYYERGGEWQNSQYTRHLHSEVPALRKYHLLSTCIEKYTNKRRAHLSSGKVKGAGAVFERVILRMLDVNPKKRGTATELRKTLEKALR